MTSTKLWILTFSFCLVSFWVRGQSNSDGATTDTASLRMAVQAHPDSLDIHKQYIKAFVASIPDITWGNQDSALVLLTDQYAAWMKQFPHSAIVPFAMGDAYANAESPKAKPYLLKAVEIDPKLAEAWMDLSIDADRWGNEKASLKYMGKAAAAKPDDPGYAFYYAFSFENVDPVKWRSMLYSLVKRFPESERGAQSLYWLAYRTKDPAEKLKVYEQLRRLYPPEKFSWSESGMNGLFEMYLKPDPEKAKELAESLKDKRGWPLLDTLAQNFIQAKKLMSQHHYSEAATVLHNAKLPRYPDLNGIRTLELAKAEDAAGNIKKAYNDLITLFAKEPTDELQAAIRRYAKKLQKGHEQIKADIWNLRKKKSKPAPPFNLGLYTSNDKLSLKDLRGKVVLLTFWFPGCGPCRGEFPHFQNVINKFKGKDVTFVGINVSPQQDEYVLPFMKGTGYTFIPLRGNSDWAQKVYKVRGEPTNFLIGKHGNIVFSDFRIDGNNERTLELMISSMLDRK